MGYGLTRGVKYNSPGSGEFKIILKMRNNGAYGDSDSEYYVKKNNTVIFSQSHKSDGKTYTDTIYVSVEFGDELILTSDFFNVNNRESSPFAF